jgi:disulfide bond formation protein DsbB
MGFIPCTLCWYQRIFMYPIFVLSAMALYKKDYGIFKYIFILSLFGGLFAFYHVLYEHNLVPHAKICGAGADCSTKYFEFLGFVTLPFLSLISFLAINALTIYSKVLSKKSKI